MMIWNKNKLKKVLEQNKKLKSSEAYQELIGLEKILKKAFDKERLKCRSFSKTNGCTHRNATFGMCDIDKCPKK